MTEKQYDTLVQQMAPKSPIVKDSVNAFWIGGLICTLGQAFINFYTKIGLEKDMAGTAASMSLVALRRSLTNRQGSVKQEDALLCPSCKLATSWFCDSKLGIQLLRFNIAVIEFFNDISHKINTHLTAYKYDTLQRQCKIRYN